MTGTLADFRVQTSLGATHYNEVANEGQTLYAATMLIGAH